MTRRTTLGALVALLALSCLLLTTGAFSAPDHATGLERAREVQEKHTARLLAKKGIVGTALGYDEDDTAVVLVFLEHANVRDVPGTLDGVRVKKHVTGVIRALADPTARFARPVPIGVSTGHPAITAGTIGCRVTDGTNVYALSNNHVFANENLAKLGDAIIQPGSYDDGASPADDIGTLDDYEPISWTSNNTMDAAIALTTKSMVGTSTPSDGYGTPSSTTRAAAVRMRVVKYGRTTGQTSARVTGINATVDVAYDGGVARFVNQIYIRSRGFSAGGDSGSLIVSQGGKEPVGLLFAGSDLATFANPIDPVLTRFGVTIDDGSTATGNPPVADFTASPTGGVAPLVVQFTDASTGSPTGWSWDFDGDDIEDSSAQNPTWTFSAGSHSIRLTVTNAYGSDTALKANYIVVTNPGGTGTLVGVSSIVYTTDGGRNQDRHLSIRMTVKNDLGHVVSGAIVSATVARGGGTYTTVSGTTGTDGSVTFKLSNIPAGTYVTTVTGVVAAGLTWDRLTPANTFTKN